MYININSNKIIVISKEEIMKTDTSFTNNPNEKKGINKKRLETSVRIGHIRYLIRKYTNLYVQLDILYVQF